MDQDINLTFSYPIEVKLREADPLGIVWHGNYVKYFEDAREAFGHEYQLTYLDIFKEGFSVPLVSIHCDYKHYLKYGDRAVVETTFISSEAPKIIFRYRIVDGQGQKVYATGETVQVFLDARDKALQLSSPDFFVRWKKKHKLLPG